MKIGLRLEQKNAFILKGKKAVNVGTEIYRLSNLATWFSKVVSRKHSQLYMEKNEAQREERWDEKHFLDSLLP